MGPADRDVCSTKLPNGSITFSEYLAMQEALPLLTATNLYKTYRKDAVKVPVLRGLNLEVNSGEYLSIVGVSGSGKSTLLHLLGTIDHPDEGKICLEGERIDN